MVEFLEWFCFFRRLVPSLRYKIKPGGEKFRLVLSPYSYRIYIPHGVNNSGTSLRKVLREGTSLFFSGEANRKSR